MASGGKKRRLGAFEIVKDLAAKGAQGKLFVGRVVEPSFPGLEVGQLVALKVMPVHSDDVERQFRRLKRRTEALAATKHPGIVRYFGCFSSVGGFSEDIHVVVMELLKGQTLEERLAGNSLGLDADEVLKIIRTCAAALSCAAEHGIIHRDIKPSNIFLCDDGGTKLIDFEIARQDGASRTTTESGALRGTVDYMAPDFHQDFRPEKGFRGDQCSDVFSLTVCLYEMLAGCRPYSAGGALGEQSMMAYFQRWTRVPGVDVNRALKIEPYKIHALAHVQKVIKRGLSPERTGRYLTYFEFSDALRAVKLREIISPTGRYQLLRCVGKGGFGVVFRARRVSDGLIVAIKCLLRPEYSERFVREAKVLNKFHDDRLVSFVEYFKTVRGATETFFIVMQFLEGMPGFSLRDRINGVKAGGRLPPREIAIAFKRFAEGLQLLHEAGVIHRDIKPANLYMPPGHPEKACVMDLGVAKTEETQTNGSLPGTLDYMPPEMATGTSRGDPAVDIYALGLCLYEALTCKTAYPRLKRGGDGLAEFYKRAKAGDKPDLSGLAGSPMWRKLVTKMTDPDVGRRIKTAREVVRLITRIPDSELPDVREKSADAADQESTDNYVLPGTHGGALPAGETGESADSDSTEVHVDNALSESPGEEEAASGEGGEQPETAPAHPPARTNLAAEEKLSAAIAEVENIIAAQETTSAAAQETTSAAAKVPDGTAAEIGGQTLVLDATVAAQETTSAAATATAATKAFDGTAAEVGGQTLVLDATAAAVQDTTTASVSATAATKAFDGTAADLGGQTRVTNPTTPEQVRPSRLPLPPRAVAPAPQPPAPQPPAPQPSAPQPSAPQPPASQPPASQPPASQPPASQPPASQPPASHPPASQPPAPQSGGPRSRAAADATSASLPSTSLPSTSLPSTSLSSSTLSSSSRTFAPQPSQPPTPRPPTPQPTHPSAPQPTHPSASLPSPTRPSATRPGGPRSRAAAAEPREKPKAEPSVIISRPKRSRAPLVIAASLAICALAVSLIAVQSKADREDKNFWEYISEYVGNLRKKEAEAAAAKRKKEAEAAAAAAEAARLAAIQQAQSNLKAKVGQIVTELDTYRENNADSRDPESFKSKLVAAQKQLDTAWTEAQKTDGVTNGVYEAVLRDCKYADCTNSFVVAANAAAKRKEEAAAAATTANTARLAAIQQAQSNLMVKVSQIVTELNDYCKTNSASTDSKSFKSKLDAAQDRLATAWREAQKTDGVTDGVCKAVLRDCKYADCTNSFVVAANAAAKRKEEAAAAATTANTVRLAAIQQAQSNLMVKVSQIVTELNDYCKTNSASTDSKSFKSKLVAAQKQLDTAWTETQKTDGVTNGVYETVLRSCKYSDCTNRFVAAAEAAATAAGAAHRAAILQAQSNLMVKVLQIMTELDDYRKNYSNVGDYKAFEAKLAAAQKQLDTAWTETQKTDGVTNGVYETVLRDCKYADCTNSFVAAAYRADFIAAADRVRTTLTNLLARIPQTDPPESLTNDLNAANTEFNKAADAAKGKGVAMEVIFNKQNTIEKLSEQILDEIKTKRQDAIQKATTEFKQKVADLLQPFTNIVDKIKTSDNPDSHTNALAKARDGIETAWKSAQGAGVPKSGHDAAIIQYETIADNVRQAIRNRRAWLDAEREYRRHDATCASLGDRAIADRKSYDNTLRDIDAAIKALPAVEASSPWKEKYEALGKKYGKLKDDISASIAKIEVKNDGEVALSVTLGGKTETIAPANSHPFDNLDVWKSYDISAVVAPGRDMPTALPDDYTLDHDKQSASTKGPKAAAVSISFKAVYKGDPKLVVENNNAVAIKVNGVEIKAGETKGLTGKPRTTITLKYACDEADYKFEDGAMKPVDVTLGNAGTTVNCVAAKLVRKDEPKIVVKMKGGRMDEWMKKHPHVEWVVTFEPSPPSNWKGETQGEIGKEFNVPAGTTAVIVTPQKNKDFWKGRAEKLDVEYSAHKYIVKLKHEQLAELDFDPDTLINWDLRKKNVKWLIAKARELDDGAEWPAWIQKPVQALLMLKEVYNVEDKDIVDDKTAPLGYRQLLQRVYDNKHALWEDQKYETDNSIGVLWRNTLKGQLERLGVSMSE